MPHIPRQVVMVSTLLTAMAGLRLAAQTQSAQPPDNYRGPDTFGMCAYVAGDTTFYGNTFSVSSYFKGQAQQAIQQYAQAHANGGQVKGARCYWSYKESDLATTKETDKRLLGLPGHSVKGVETGWTFRPGATATATGASTTRTMANAGTTSGGTAASRTNYGTNYGTAYGASTASSGQAAGTGTSTATGTMNTVSGGAQSQLSSAKSGAVASAATGVTSITTSAVGGATSAMQGLGGRLFRGNGGQTKAAAAPASTAATAPAAMPGAPASAAAPQEVASNAPGLGLGIGAMEPGRDSTAGAGAGTLHGPVEGLVADVSGSDLIVNIGQGAGVAPGALLVVMHPQRVVKDPATGKVLRTVESQVGQLKITSAENDSASGTFTGTGIPVVGDKVRSAPR